MARRLALVPAHGDRTVLYIRVSALMGREGETFHSPDLQANAMRQLIERRGLREVALIEDLDVSGRTFERAGIQRVLEMARAGQVDVVAIYDLSRLGRNTSESLRTIAELRELHVTVISTVEQIDDTPEGQFQLGVFLGMAQLYSDQISRRWRQVVEHRSSQGRMHGVIPAGYRRTANGDVEVDADLAPLVVEVFRSYAAGERMWHIVQRWRAVTGRRTSFPGIKGMLRNPAYVGKIRMLGEVHDGRHEPIIGAALWAKVQRRLVEDSKTPPRRLALANSLAGLAVCAECKGSLSRHHDGQRGRTVLECRRAVHHRDCGGVGRPLLKEVEAKVLADLEAHAKGLTDIGAQAARRAERTNAKVDVKRIGKLLAETEAALGHAAADHARRLTTAEEYRAAALLLRADVDSLKAQLSDSERTAAAPSSEGVVKLAVAIRKRWDTMTAAERNRALKPLVRKVFVRRSEFWREPVEARVTTDFA